MKRQAIPIGLVLLLLSLSLPATAAAGSPGIASAAVWIGRFDAFETVHSNEVGGELRFDPVLSGKGSITWHLAPAAGVMHTSKGAWFVHTGLRLDLPLTARFTLTPQFGAGYYEPGDDKVLGGHFHFRSGLEASLRVTPRNRVGLLLYHLSNAGLNAHNPGEESLVVEWAVSF